jgi:Ferritin-like protein
MISKNLAKAINDQINAELWSAYLYLSMSMDAYKKGFKGVANWFQVQFREEQDHAEIFINYLHSQDEKVLLAPIASVDQEWTSILAAYEDTLKHEKEVTAMINNLCNIASNDNDYAAQNFLAWFIDEQIEEEQNVRDLIYQCKMLEGNNYGMYMLDKELAARVYVQAAPLTAAAQ